MQAFIGLFIRTVKHDLIHVRDVRVERDLLVTEMEPQVAQNERTIDWQRYFGEVRAHSECQAN